MEMIMDLVTQMWRNRLDYEVQRQTLKGRLYALKVVLGSTRRLVLFTLYILLFLYSFFGALTVAVTAESLAQDLRPLLIYTALSLGFGGVLLYNLREQTWIKRWGLDAHLQALEARAHQEATQASAAPDAQDPYREMVRVLERFERQMEQRLEDFEERQRKEINRVTATYRDKTTLPNGYHQEPGLY